MHAQAFFIFLNFVFMHHYCHCAVVPVRKEPSDKSEQVTQLLFGESVDVLEKQAKWSLIRGEDGYEGWIDNKQYQASEAVFEQYVLNQREYLHHINGQAIYLPHGSKLNRQDNSLQTLPWQGSSLAAVCQLYLNTPYLWGGKSVYGIDCSGLMQQTFKVHGLLLPRDAWQQAELGETIHLPAEAQCGDLAFFDNADGKIIHVGMLLSPTEIIHASGWVRIDAFDHQGIFNRDLKQYSHKLRIIKRIQP